MTYRARCAGRQPKGHAPRWGRIISSEPVTLISSVDILKDIYTNGWQRPWWAKLARDRHWMTWTAYYEVPMSEPAPRLTDILYAENPFYKILKKDSGFYESSSADEP